MRIAPGLYLNFSTSGVSATIGPRGLSINLSEKGVYLNMGLPGTGIYSRTKIGPTITSASSRSAPQERKPMTPLKSAPVGSLTTMELSELRQEFYQVLRGKYELEQRCQKAKRVYRATYVFVVFAKLILLGFLPVFRRLLLQKAMRYHRLCLKRDKQMLIVEAKLEGSFAQEFAALVEAFSKLTQGGEVWDVVARDFVPANAAYDLSFGQCERVSVRLSFGESKFLKILDHHTLCWQNANGATLYFYPFFVIAEDLSGMDIAFIDYKSLFLRHGRVRFLENKPLPGYVKRLGESYLYVRRDGMRDMRYRENPSFPVVEYYKVHFETPEGLNELYLFASSREAEDFCCRLEKYIEHLRKIGFSL